MYVTETAETSIRGTLGIVMNIMMTTGFLYVNALGSFVDWVPLTGTLMAFPS